jgi:hypothetical protein
VSTQGKGTKKRKKGKVIESTVVMSDTIINDTNGPERPEHFGLNCMIRMWFATAIRRRSFDLMAKAAALAKRAGISMDDVFRDDSLGREKIMHGVPMDGMGFLAQVMFMPSDTQQVTGSRLRWSELPEALLLAAEGCKTESQSKSLLGHSGNQEPEDWNQEPEDLSHLGNRWIIIREIHCGISRYFVSPAFERDIVTWSAVDETYKANKRSVLSLIFTKIESKESVLKAMNQQVALHAKPNMPAVASKFSATVMLSPTCSPDLKMSRAQVERTALVDPTSKNVDTFNWGAVAAANKGAAASPPTVASSIQQCDVLECHCNMNLNHVFLFTELLLEAHDPNVDTPFITSTSQTTPALMQQWLESAYGGNDMADELDCLIDLLGG